MVQRATRELQVEMGRELGPDHLRLVSEFSAARDLEEGTRAIFSRIPEYLSASPTAWVFSARTGSGKLAGFDIAEFAPSRYAFYMFNFLPRENPIPGTSDFLLAEIVRAALEQGKKAINLGLGIGPGITFFKRKWGGKPFLEHRFAIFQCAQPAIPEGLLSKL
jgi:primosomal protein N'